MSHSCFFYGTLMAPAVLARVTARSDILSQNTPSSSTNKNNKNTTESPSTTPPIARPALLKNYRRHKVKFADYPAITPDSSPAAEVRGTWVQGLTDSDMFRLDVFEGEMYEKRVVSVELLPETDNKDSGTLPKASESAGGKKTEMVECEVYVWKEAFRSHLEDEEWDFDEFVREKLWRWAGSKRDESEYKEVDEAVQAQGVDPTGGRAVGGGFEERVANGP